MTKTDIKAFARVLGYWLKNPYDPLNREYQISQLRDIIKEAGYEEILRD